MPTAIEVTVSRSDLPEVNREFRLEDKDLDLAKAKVWIDNVPVDPSSPRKRDRFVGTVKIATDSPSILVVTTEAGRPIAVLKGDQIDWREETPPHPGKRTSSPPGKKTPTPARKKPSQSRRKQTPPPRRKRAAPTSSRSPLGPADDSAEPK